MIHIVHFLWYKISCIVLIALIICWRSEVRLHARNKERSLFFIFGLCRLKIQITNHFNQWSKQKLMRLIVECQIIMDSVAQLVKNLPAMQETRVWSLGQEDTPKKGMATHCSILAGKFHGQRNLACYSPWGCKELDMTEWLTLGMHGQAECMVQ